MKANEHLGVDDGYNLEDYRIMAETASSNAAMASQAAHSSAVYIQQLCQWVEYYKQQTADLLKKVKELEDWKKSTAESMRKLREDHRNLKRRCGYSEEVDSTSALAGKKIAKC